MKLHFENNKPFLTATSVSKDIEVSHWGNVAVDELYELRHDGAKLKVIKNH
jgi:oligosaccharyltransferase complex subunit alpha (ribophorin I)